MVQDLLNKLNNKDDSIEANKMAVAPKAPVPPVPPGNYYRGTEMRSEVSDGVILDLGEGISLHIPIERRMSLSDFLKVAEKVKALELLSEEANHHHATK